jgi:hypothetical protein
MAKLLFSVIYLGRKSRCWRETGGFCRLVEFQIHLGLCVCVCARESSLLLRKGEWVKPATLWLFS